MTVPLESIPVGARETEVASAPVSDPSLQDPYVSIILPCYNEQDHVTAARGPSAGSAPSGPGVRSSCGPTPT